MEKWHRFVTCAGQSKGEIGMSKSGSETGKNWQKNGWQKNGFDEGGAIVEQWLSDGWLHGLSSLCGSEQGGDRLSNTWLVIEVGRLRILGQRPVRARCPHSLFQPITKNDAPPLET